MSRHQKFWAQGVSVVAVITVVLGAHAVCAAGDWETDYKSKDTRVQTRVVEGSGIEAIRAFVHLPWTPQQIAELMFSDKAQRKYTVGLKDMKVLGSTTTSKGRSIKTVYQRMEYPAIDDRDVVLKFTMGKKAGKAGDVWKIGFKPVGGNIPHKAGAVRITQLEGGWTISPHPSGTGSKVTYTCHVEVGGNVPDFMVNAAQVDNFRSMMTTFRALLTEKYGAK